MKAIWEKGKTTVERFAKQVGLNGSVLRRILPSYGGLTFFGGHAFPIFPLFSASTHRHMMMAITRAELAARG